MSQVADHFADEPREQTPPSAEALPSSLAFGMLDRASIRTASGMVTATYRVDDDPCYEVEWAQERCWLRELYEGGIIGGYSGRDLKEALFAGLRMIQDPSEHPRFLQLARRVLAAGKNVYFRFPGRNGERYFFYPAGLLYCLHQPVIAQNREAWEAFKSRVLNDKSLSSILRLVSEGPGVILRLMADGEVRVEEVTVATLGATLLALEQAVWICAQSGITPPGLVYRLSVLEVSDTVPTHLIVHPGEPAAGELIFALVPEALAGIRFPSREQVIEVFKARGARFAASLGPRRPMDLWQSR